MNGGLTNMINTGDNPVIESGNINTPEGIIRYDVINPHANKTPLILINGGPCGCRDMLYRTIGRSITDRPVVSYTQMNSKGSKPISRKDNSYWTLKYYTEEIERVRAELGYKEVLLFGHSFGGTLAINYASLYPENCVGIITASPVIETKTWIIDTQKRLAEIKPEIDVFMESISNMNFASSYLDNIRSKAEMALFSSRYQSSLFSPDIYFKYFIEYSAEELSTKREVYNYMWGPSEYEVTGTLKDMDISGLLPKIKVPVLFICGEFDEIYPDTLETYSKTVQDSNFYIIKGGTHCGMEDASIEEKNKLTDVLNEWIESSELKRIPNYIQI